MDLGLGSLIGSGIGAIGNYFTTKQNNKEQARIAKEQFDYTNEYNSPVNQVQRLQEAGLNPALAMGNGQASTGNAAPANYSQSYQPYENPVANVMATLGQYAQIKTQMAMANKAEEDTRLASQRVATQAWLNLKHEADSEFNKSNALWKNQILSEQHRNLSENADYTAARRKMAVYNYDHMRHLYVQHLESQIAGNNASTDLKISQNKVLGDPMYQKYSIDNMKFGSFLRKNQFEISKPLFGGQNTNSLTRIGDILLRALIGFIK